MKDLIKIEKILLAIHADIKHNQKTVGLQYLSFLAFKLGIIDIQGFINKAKETNGNTMQDLILTTKEE